jgi:hypothetical protein
MAAMANSFGAVHEDRFPLTATVHLETDGREIHRETIKTGGVLDLRPVAATLDKQFPGKKAIRVVDRDGKVVMKAGRLPTD